MQTGHDLKLGVGLCRCPRSSLVELAAFVDEVEKSQATWADAGTVMKCVFAVHSGKMATTLVAYAKVAQRYRGRLFNSFASIAEAG
jgi:hypothetical protein